MKELEQKLATAEKLISEISQTYETHKDIKEDNPESREGQVLLHTVMKTRQYLNPTTA